MSEPTISVAIRDLEQEYGVRLFLREKKHLSLTEEGRFFYNSAKAILERIDRLDSEMHAMAARSVSVRVGVSPLCGVFVFLPLFGRFHAAHPEVNVEMFEYGTTDALNQLEAGQLDFAIIIENDRIRQWFDALPLKESSMRFIVNRSHHLAERERIHLSELRDEDLLLLRSRSYETAALVHEQFEALGITPRVLFSASNTEMSIQYVLKYEVGVIAMQELAGLNPALVGIPIEPEIPLRIVFVEKREQPLRREAELFREFVLEVREELFPGPHSCGQ